MSLEGQPAPGFDLQGSDGMLHSLKEYRGKFLVLFFYPKDNTKGCTSEAVGFARLHPLFQQAGAVVVGVSRDTIKSHQKFISDFQLPFTLLSDPDASVMTAYGAYGEKVQYGKKSMGTIRSTVVIAPDGTVVRHWPKVPKAAEHPEQVFEFLKTV